LAFGGGFQTTLTFVNYSPEAVSCQTTFYSDSGGALQVPFAGGSLSARTDSLGAGADIHVQTTASANAASEGWAQSECTGPVKASLLYRLYSGSVAQGEAGVNATTTPATEFVTFAQTQTGIAYANPSSVPATITIAALDSTGAGLGQTSLTLQPNAHGAANIGPLLGVSSFTGSVQITSTAPIVSLSLNAEAFPVFSSLPSGDLPAGTPLAPVSITFPVASDHIAVVSGNSQTASAGQASSHRLSRQSAERCSRNMDGVSGHHRAGQLLDRYRRRRPKLDNGHGGKLRGNCGDYGGGRFGIGSIHPHCNRRQRHQADALQFRAKCYQRQR
jgi:hypothetical protein